MTGGDQSCVLQNLVNHTVKQTIHPPIMLDTEVPPPIHFAKIARYLILGDIRGMGGA